MALTNMNHAEKFAHDCMDDAYHAIYHGIIDAMDYVDRAVDAVYAADKEYLFEALSNLEAYADEHIIPVSIERDTDAEVEAMQKAVRTALMEAYFAIDRSDPNTITYVQAATHAAYGAGNTALAHEADDLEAFARKCCVFNEGCGFNDASNAAEEPEDHCRHCNQFHYQCVCHDIQKQLEKALDEELEGY